MHINKVNGMRYIGTTGIKPHRRWNNGNGYKGQPFYEAIKEYGWNAFEHIIIYTNLSKDKAMELEYDLIEKYKTTDVLFGYNIVKGGRGVGIMDHTTKNKISESMKKAYAIGSRKPPMFERHHTRETKKKISIGNYKTGKYNTYAI